MKNLILPFSLFLFLLIPLSPTLAVNSTAPQSTDSPQQISAQEIDKSKLSFKEKFLLKRLEKKSKKNRGEPSGDNGFAVASMVLGILSLLGGGLVLGVIAIVMAGIAFKRMRHSGEDRNRGMAIAGLVTGIIACTLTLGVIGLILLAL